MEEEKKHIEKLIENNQHSIAEKIVELQYKSNPEYLEKYGELGRQKSIRDAAYHLPFLTEAILMEDEEIFCDYVEWVKLLFREIGLPARMMTETLRFTKEVLHEYIPREHHTLINRYIDAGIARLDEPVQEIKSYINPDTRMGKLAKDFNQTLLEGNKNEASRLIMDEVAKGTSIKEIYLQVFQVSQLEVGRLWLMNKINVAKEHYVSAATQMIMSQLYPQIFSTDRKGLCFVGACVGGELHEIGIRMVGDFFEMEGWDTYYLGANTPANTITEAIEEYNADIVGLSIAMPYHQSVVKNVINEIRQNLGSRKTKILIGGNGLNQKPDIWRSLGADGYAPDAEKAVELANKLIQ